MTVKTNLREDVVAKGAEIGQGAYATAKDAVAIGTLNAAAGSDSETEGSFATAAGAVQIGPGTNDVPNTLKVGANIVAGPIRTGAVAPTGIVPAFAGQLYIDTAAPRVYVAKAATADTDWVDVMADEAGV